MTTLECVVVPSANAERLMPILHHAEEDDDRIRAALAEPGCHAYAALVAAIQTELPAHGRTLLVGTANCALDNIAFYQKCGFRMHSVKRDYFDYIQPTLQEYGIPMRDMIVFSYAAVAD